MSVAADAIAINAALAERGDKAGLRAVFEDASRRFKMLQTIDNTKKMSSLPVGSLVTFPGRLRLPDGTFAPHTVTGRIVKCMVKNVQVEETSPVLRRNWSKVPVSICTLAPRTSADTIQSKTKDEPVQGKSQRL